MSGIGGASKFHQLQWEALEDPSLWENFAKTVKVSVQRCYHLPAAFQFRARRVFNLAYIVARPGFRRDKYIDHRLLLRSLVTTIDNIDRLALEVKLEAIRPGRSLENDLESLLRQPDWVKDMLKLDTSDLTREELKFLTLVFGLTLDHENGDYLSKSCFEIQKLMLQRKVDDARKLVLECLDLAVMKKNL